MTLHLISIGLTDEKDLSQRAREAASECDKLYAELYTMKLATTLAALTEITGRPVTHLRRGDLEEHADTILEEAKTRNIGVMVGGDCLSATTHISLILEAAKQGIRVNIIHGSSIFTAIAETGLSLYKFGRTVTLPFEEKGPVDTTLHVVEDNLNQGLHTLVLLDLDNEAGKYMTVSAGLRRLLDAGFNPKQLVVGVARLGSKGSRIKAGEAGSIQSIDFGEAPHSLIIPAGLHFMEEDALNLLADCPRELLRGRQIQSELERLIEKYTTGCLRVRGEMTTRSLPAEITQEQLTALLDHVDRYLSDAQYYSTERKPTALTSVAYAEGILDALRLLGLADFEW